MILTKKWYAYVMAQSTTRLFTVHNRQQKEALQLLLLYTAVACSICGVLWSLFILKHLGFCTTALIPIVFPLVVLPVTAWAHWTDNYKALTRILCLFIILVPSAIQFSLGSGFCASVMLWGIVAPITGLLYLTQGEGVLMLLLYLACVISPSFFDIRLSEDARLITNAFINNFYSINLVFPSSIAIGALWYLVRQLGKNQTDAILLMQEINLKHNELISSIEYAQRLQRATLPNFNTFREYFPNSFLLESPKSIVSGDFFWSLQIEDRHYFAVADATGHGVPGALMTVVCNKALNESILFHNKQDVGEILKAAKTNIVASLANNKTAMRDGMDIGLCCFQNGFLHFAGAKFTLHLFRKQGIVETTRGNRQSIGNDSINKPFTTFLFKIENGDRLYLTTDGYLDQFGGKKDRKFRHKNFVATISGAQSVGITNQEQFFLGAHLNWRGNNDQLDDICLLGLEL